MGDIDAVHFWQMCAYLNDRPVPWVEMVEVPRQKRAGATSERRESGQFAETTTTRRPGSMGELEMMLKSVGKH